MSEREMAMVLMHLPWAFIFGIIGNIISFMVFLAPIPTFAKIVQKKSSEGYQSVPYSVGLFSCMLLIYYAILKTNSILLITINSFGCVIETTYLIIYTAYASKKARGKMLSLLFLFNFGAFSLIAVCTNYFVKGPNRVQVIGWICLALNLGVFVAPLGIMRQVIRTKSVEFMPFSLSLFLTLNAVAWFFYGLLQKDFYIYLPNTLGFAFGIVQMALYVFYKNCNKVPDQEQGTTTSTSVPDHQEYSLAKWDEKREGKNQKLQLHTMTDVRRRSNNFEENDSYV